MKRFVLLVTMFLVVGGMAFADLELGMGFSPPLGEPEIDPFTGEPEEQSGIFSFHVGYSFLWLFYAAWDAYVMPPDVMQPQTGFNRPGFVNMYNVGVRPRLGPLMAMATVGINQNYVYRQNEPYEFGGLNGEYESPIGANMRLGFGWRSPNNWSVMASAVAAYPSIDDLVTTLTILSAEPGTEYTNSRGELETVFQEDIDRVVADTLNRLYPTITVSLWF